MADRRCPCGFHSPLCLTCHRPDESTNPTGVRFQVNYEVLGQALGDLVIIARDLEQVHQRQPDCVLECKLCKTRRTLTMRYVRRAQQLKLEPRCYVCRPHVAAPRKRAKKKGLTYWQRRVRDQLSQGAQ